MKIASALLAALGFSSCGEAKPTPAPPRPTVDFSKVEQIAGTITSLESGTVWNYRPTSNPFEEGTEARPLNYVIATIALDSGIGTKRVVTRYDANTEINAFSSVPLAPGTHVRGAYVVSPTGTLDEKDIISTLYRATGTVPSQLIKAEGILL